MILATLMMIDAIRRFKTLESWRYGFFALMWIFVIGGLANMFLAGGGTLDDPTGDGIVTVYIRQATNDGPLMAVYGILVMILVYVPFLFLWVKAGKAAKN